MVSLRSCDLGLFLKSALVLVIFAVLKIVRREPVGFCGNCVLDEIDMKAQVLDVTDVSSLGRMRNKFVGITSCRDFKERKQAITMHMRLQPGTFPNL